MESPIRLTQTEYRVMVSIGAYYDKHRISISMLELSHEIGFAKSVIHYHVHRLKERGLITYGCDETGRILNRTILPIYYDEDSQMKNQMNHTWDFKDGTVEVVVRYVSSKGWEFCITCDAGTVDKTVIEDGIHYVTWQAARQNAHLNYAHEIGETLTGKNTIG